MFKRREKLSLWQNIVEGFWPKAGWPRVISYFRHRIRRLPDSPEKVGRGMFAGMVVTFLPVPGLQMVLSGLVAWAIRGNILAAVLCSFVSNPVTTPFIAVASLAIGQWILGQDTVLSARMIGNAFSEAGSDLWYNMAAPFTDNVASWIGLQKFMHTIFLPYFVGALIIGLIGGAIAYYVTVPLVRAYQRARAIRLADRALKLKEARALKDRQTIL